MLKVKLLNPMRIMVVKILTPSALFSSMELGTRGILKELPHQKRITLLYLFQVSNFKNI